MMKSPEFHGGIPALATSFHKDLSLDADGFGRLAEAVIADGVHGCW